MNVEFTASDMETAETLGDYLSSVFIEEREYTQSSSDRVDTDARFSRIHINREDVTERLLTLQMDEALEPDYIHPAPLTNCARIISSPLTLIPEAVQEGKLSSDWKLENVIPIYKKGKTEAGNSVLSR